LVEAPSFFGLSLQRSPKLRMLFVVSLGLFLTVAGHAADPKPPWQRLLTGDDAKKAAGLERRIEELEAADKYAAAIRLGEELLALRTNVQGAEHWETVNRKWALAALKKVDALPEDKRIGWRQAKQGHAEGFSHGWRQIQIWRHAGSLPAWFQNIRGHRVRNGRTSVTTKLLLASRLSVHNHSQRWSGRAWVHVPFAGPPLRRSM
jgi:hypothetical protein